ncbi:MAG: hypothetical protein COB53_10715 [Elusimicrobia bacterium]|nr:MAG: hypothetical protein COB53_10715 [Elusimicrobiota bacterium]
MPTLIGRHDHGEQRGAHQLHYRISAIIATMHIVIEEPLHSDGRGGVAVYNRRMIRLISEMDPENQYSLFTYCWNLKPEVKKRVTPPEGARWKHWHAGWPERLLRPLEWNVGIPIIESHLKFGGADLYHAHRIPASKSLPLVTTVYDLFSVVHPEWTSSWMTQLFEEIVRPGLDRVERIMAISTQTKTDLIERWNVPEEKIEVILWGVDRELFKPLSEEILAPIRKKYDLPELYFVLVGPFDPWSDPRPSIRALAKLPDAALVMAGPHGSCYEDAQRLAAQLGVADRCRWLGHVPQPELVGIYNAARGLLFASGYEGFGLPTLEAMACGTPVITSNSSALPEVAGGAAILVDHDSDEQILAGMTDLLDNGKHADLREKGLARAAALTWEDTARKTLAVYKNALAGR